MQQIHSGMQEIRQLEQRVIQLRDEKVGSHLTRSTMGSVPSVMVLVLL